MLPLFIYERGEKMPHSDFTGFYLEEKEREERAKAEKRNEKGHASEAQQESAGTQTEEQSSLEEKTVSELKELAKEKDVEGYSNMKKAELLESLEE